MIFQNTDALAQDMLDPYAQGFAGVAPVYYHGTLERHLDSILKNGLSHKATLNLNHVCLATRAHVAHFFGNINAAFSHEYENVVIITIPGAALDPQHFCIETAPSTVVPMVENKNGAQTPPWKMSPPGKTSSFAPIPSDTPAPFPSRKI